MKAVILAAGRGKRLEKLTEDKPKPLVPLAGRPLLSRILENLSRSGIKEAIIVIGYRGELIKQAIGNVSAGIKISYVENPEWRQDNLFSLIAFYR